MKKSMDRVYRVLSLFLLIVVYCSFPASIMAQSSMSDDAVIKYAQKEYAKGTSKEQIVIGLQQRGVDIEQLRRVRKKMEKMQKENGSMGLISSGGKTTSSQKDRLRKNNTSKLQTPLKKDEDDSDLTDRERKQMRQKQELLYEDEYDKIFPNDSLWDELGSRDKRKVFGRDIFNQKNLSFEPNMNLPTPQNYTLGAGDVVYVDIYGASQKSVESTVSPDGTINIEDFGPVSVSGLTVAQANARLKSTLGARYANSKIRLTVGQTKTIRVNVIGEVKVPGSYELSAFATVFHALYYAGGTNDIGTLRNIKVYRKGRLMTTVDIYDYILNGKLTGNIRLAEGDVIIIGPYDCLVNIAGKVKRPMYYEMRSNESVGKLIDYAGGFTGDAYQKDVRLTRKTGGEYSVYTIGEFDRTTFKLADGDSLTVDSLIPRYKNMVEVKGAVFRPGKYQMDGNIQTVRDLIIAAGGLREDAFAAHAVMHRRCADRTYEALSIDLEGLMNNTVADIALRNEDELFIASSEEENQERTFKIYGEVRYPGTYRYASNTTIEDLVIQAGGLKDAASYVKVDVSRRLRNKKANSSNSLLAKTYTFSLKEGLVVDGTPGFVLEPYDEIYVRRSPGYTEQKHVSVIGEIAFEGEYTLTSKNQRLSDIVKLAGGVTPSAYPAGARLERVMTYDEIAKQKSIYKLLNSDSINVNQLDLGETRPIGIDLEKALKYPGDDKWDIVLEEGDRLVIPQYTNVVSIKGNVRYPNTVSYTEGEGMKYYINQAGGFGQNAKKNSVFVIHMNGTVSPLKSNKDITPGCDIIVPSRPKRRGMNFAEIMSMGSITATLGAVIATLVK